MYGQVVVVIVARNEEFDEALSSKTYLILLHLFKMWCGFIVTLLCTTITDIPKEKVYLFLKSFAARMK
jgi:hypothetical protein